MAFRTIHGRYFILRQNPQCPALLFLLILTYSYIRPFVRPSGDAFSLVIFLLPRVCQNGGGPNRPLSAPGGQTRQGDQILALQGRLLAVQECLVWSNWWPVAERKLQTGRRSCTLIWTLQLCMVKKLNFADIFRALEKRQQTLEGKERKEREKRAYEQIKSLSSSSFADSSFSFVFVWVCCCGAEGESQIRPLFFLPPSLPFHFSEETI